MKQLLSLAIALSAIAFCSANATCATKDTTGRWSTNMITTTLGSVTWIHCGISISPSGAVKSTSSCLTQSGGKTTVTGQLSLIQPEACRYGGALTFANNSKTPVFIDLATMSDSKDVIEGVGDFGALHTGVLFNAVKNGD
jgi:hypothetical protein